MAYKVEQIRANEVSVGDVVQVVKGRGNWYPVLEAKPADHQPGMTMIRFDVGRTGYVENIPSFDLVNIQVKR